MKKYFLVFIVFLFVCINVNANEDYSNYIKNLANCSVYKYYANSTELEILGWKNGACYLRETTCTYNIPDGVDYFSLTKEQLKQYIVPTWASIYRLTKSQLIDYRKSLIKGLQNAKDNTSVTVSTQNQNSIKAIKNYKYKNGKWETVDIDSYMVY